MEVFGIKPILYAADATNFNSQGIGVLKDAIRQKVTEERNGIYEYEFDYPIDGRFFEELSNDRIVKIEASKKSPNQRFKIVNVKKKEDGWIHVACQHVSYLAMSLGLKPDVSIDRLDATQALETWRAGIIDKHPFTVWSNIGTLGSTNFGFDDFENPRQALGGVQGSILDRWGGEYEFDNYNIKLWGARGAKRNVVIAYGKNLRTLEQEEQIQTTYTTIYPYAKVTKDNQEKLITLPEYYVDAPTADKFSHRRVMRLDCSNNNEEITIEKLRQLAQDYIKSNDIGYPKVSLDVTYLDLSQTLDYKGLEKFEEVNLCDTVKIYFEKLGVNVEAKVKKVVYNPDLQQYDSIELGDARYSLSDKLSSMESIIADLTKNMLTGPIAQAMMDYQTELISGTYGGSMIVRYTDEGLPYELIFMDTDNINTARECLRINRRGIGFSTTGWQGPYTSAWTIDGKFNANFIRVGRIASEGLFIDMDTGEVKFTRGEITGPSLSINMTTGQVLFKRGIIESAEGNMKIDITKGVIEGPVIRSFRNNSVTSGIEIQAGDIRVLNNSNNQIGFFGSLDLTGSGSRITNNQGKPFIVGTENAGKIGTLFQIPANSTQTNPILNYFGTHNYSAAKIDTGNGKTMRFVNVVVDNQTMPGILFGTTATGIAFGSSEIFFLLSGRAYKLSDMTNVTTQFNGLGSAAIAGRYNGDGTAMSWTDLRF